MRVKPSQQVIQLLRFSGGETSIEMKNLSRRDCEHLLQWLYDTGLVFYFFRKVKELKAEASLPEILISSLERDFAANQRRAADMLKKFDSINRTFNQAGIPYAVVKGFSLVPEFCPDADFRYQGDFDYLVGEDSLQTAEHALAKLGYSLKARSGQESMFGLPDMPKAERGAKQFSEQAAHAIELHLDIWDSELFRLRPIPKFLFPERARIQQMRGLAFPGFDDTDAFLIQVLHASQHFFSSWMKMSLLFEIGYFLNRRHCDAPLWEQVEQRVGSDSMLRDFVVLIAALAETLFAAPLPGLIRRWGRIAHPSTRLWIDTYARQWVLDGMPGYQLSSLFPVSKLVVFIQQAYREEGLPDHMARDRMLPLARFQRILASLRQKPLALLERRWWARNVPIQRSLFHMLSGLRYLYELPRWRWKNRKRLGSLRANT